jgi:hypothetical protein
MAANIESYRETGDKKGQEAKDVKKVTFHDADINGQANTTKFAADSRNVLPQQDNVAAKHQEEIPTCSDRETLNTVSHGGNFIDLVDPALQDENFATAVANAVIPIMTPPGSTRVLRWKKDADTGVWTLDTPAGYWIAFGKNT